MSYVVFGLGHIGAAVAVHLASTGSRVRATDRSSAIIEARQSGARQSDEAALDQSFTRLVQKGLLQVEHPSALNLSHDDVVVVAAGSPPGSEESDADCVEQVLKQVFREPELPTAVIVVSTLAPGTCDRFVTHSEDPAQLRARLVHCPVFTNQGRALEDINTPDRLIIGAWNLELVPLAETAFAASATPIIRCTPLEAEMVKHTANAYIAARISFINEIANFCSALGVPVDTVVQGIGHDPRIGSTFWRPGLGFNDHCLPKDVRALIDRAAEVNVPMPALEGVLETNENQWRRAVAAIESSVPSGARIAALGVCYEPGNPDLTYVASAKVIDALTDAGHEVLVWDRDLPRAKLGERFPLAHIASSLEEAAETADVVLVLTAYPEVIDGGWLEGLARGHDTVVVVDTINGLARERVVASGLEYIGIGRPQQPAGDGQALV